MVLDNQGGFLTDQALKRRDHAAEVFDMREYVGEGDEVRLTVSRYDLLSSCFGEEIMDGDVPLCRAVLRGRGRLDADGGGAFLAEVIEKASIITADIDDFPR